MGSRKTIYQNNTNRTILYSCQTVWPFVLFPNELIIDKKKVSIIHSQFLTRHIDTINIADILSASVYHGPLFGSIQIITRFFTQKSINFTHLSKNDAIKARALIQGLIIADEKNIHFENMENEDIVNQCLELGKASK